jgi:hypothetical protein
MDEKTRAMIIDHLWASSFLFLIKIIPETRQIVARPLKKALKAGS